MRSMKQLVLLLVALFVLPGISFAQEPGADAMNKSLAQASNQFGLQLFGKLAKLTPGDNVFVSPLSLSMALTMTTNGASGQTESDMKKTLQLKDLSLEKINAGYQALVKTFVAQDAKVQIQIANAIWTAQTLVPKKNYVESMKKYYNAKISSLDPDVSKALSIINDWVKQETRGKIPQIVDSLNGVALLLANAIYFKGSWTNAFDAKRTHQDIFQGAQGKKISVQMMEMGRKDFSYQENADFQAINLPYGDKKMSMALFLPKAGKSMENLIQIVSQKKWSDWSSQFSAKEGALSLPRFEIRYGKELSNELMAMGMEIAFSNKADFGKISSGLAISKVIHKSFIRVDEEGTEAAAATVVVMRGGASLQSESFELRLDRPFLFLIHDHNTGAILFVGMINDPKTS